MLRKITITFISALLCACALTFTAFADETYVYDEAGLFSEYEKETLESQLSEVSEYTGWQVIVLTTNDIGDDKSDYGATDYADMYFETRYGQDTDGILYMINNDTKYDRISSSGECL